MVLEGKLLIALALDLCFGDPRWLPHPVKIIGGLAGKVEQITRTLIPNAYIAGGASVFVVVVFSALFTGLILKLSLLFATFFTSCVAILFLYLSIAIKDLFIHSKDVYCCLEKEKDIEKARLSVSKIVGRDTSTLKEGGVIKACIESVSENMVDGITAPIFWAIMTSFLAPLIGIDEIGWAAIGAMTYKSINTLDSMFGYRNERYLQFGKTAARLDDIVNWPVARLSGVALVLAAFFMKLNGKRAFRIYMRDRDKHLSPNAAHSEAAVAGALGVRLGGSSKYDGLTVYKPTIGDVTRKVCSDDILKTNRIVIIGVVIFIISMTVVRQSILFF